METDTYYINGLRRQASAPYARQYLGIENAAGEVLLTNFNNSVVTGGYFVGNTPLWQDVRIPMSSLRPGASLAPTPSAFIGGTRAYRWDNAGGIESLEFELQTPHGFDTSATYGARLHLHWTCGSNMTGLGVVAWNVEVTYAHLGAPGDVFGATNTYFGTGATTAAFQHIETDLHTFTDLRESTVIVGTIWRQIGGLDTYAGNDVFGLSLDCHFPMKQLGSVNEFP